MIKLCFVIGTRPEFIKMKPLIAECARRRIPFFIIHTGQHYSRNLDAIFFKELGLPAPKYNLGVGSGTQAETTGRIIAGVEKILMKERPDIVLVQGDTNSVLGGALAAVKMGIKVGHVEAGLRSYFRGMPEEVNRVLTDHASDVLFAPTPSAARILKKEGIDPRWIFMTGNTVVDVLRANFPRAERASKILARLRLAKKKYILLTLHRAENVDDSRRLAGIIAGIDAVAENTGMEVVFPAHPRTVAMMRKKRLRPRPLVRIIDPVRYSDFLMLEANARLILTDSGGVQEEACILGVGCVTLRDNTERPETVAVGANILAGAEPRNITAAAKKMLGRKKRWRQPFGDGRAAVRIMDIIMKKISART